MKGDAQPARVPGAARTARQTPGILVLRGGAIGDFIMTLPALEALRRRWPTAFIELIGYPHIAGLGLAGGLVDRVTSLDQAEIARLFSLRPSIPEAQAQHIRSFDLIISYLYDPDGTVKRNMLAVGARQVIYASPRVERVHAVRHLFKPLEELALYPQADAVPRLRLGAAARERGRVRAAGFGRRVMALHPGSGSPAKNWPLGRFIDLARRVVEAGDLQPVFIIGEADRALADEMAASAGRLPRLSGCSLLELAGFLSACEGYAGNDSGVTHVAAALGIPVVALFGPSDPQLWGPVGDRVRIVRSAQPTTDSLAAVDVETVLDAVRGVLPWRFMPGSGG